MLTFFRSFIQSKVGIFLALGFLGLIALAFAAGDISSSGQFGSVTGGDRVASVGDRKIGSAELNQGATNALAQAKQQNPQLNMKAFLAAGGLNDAADQLIDRAAISEFGAQHGLAVSDRLVDSEIAKIAAFHGPDGKFSETAYRGLLQQRGLNDRAVRQDLGDGLIARQILVPAAFGARMPGALVAQYTALLTETRVGSIATIPATAFAPRAEPGAAELAAFYTAHRNNYIRPERRVLRYAVFDDSAIKTVAPPTESEIAARYTANKALYGPSENRTLTQLVLPTQGAANAVLAEITAGKSIADAASAKGLAAAKIGPLSRSTLAAQTNDAIAAAAFSSPKGKLIGPVRGSIGWALIRVDAIDAKPAKTLDQAKAEIATALSLEKRRAALTDFSTKVEEQFDNGSSLSDVVKQQALTIRQTDPITADGKLYGKAGTAPAELTRLLATAFAMEREGQPQLAEIVPGKQFIVFDVAQITPSAAAPIAEIRPDVIADLMLQKGAIAAKAAAEKVQAQARKGTDLGTAMAALGVGQLPPVNRITINRQQFAQTNQAVPPPLALMFSMAQGTVKVLAAPGNRGWFVVSLAKIVPGETANNAPLLADASKELSALTGREYADQLRAAIRQDVGVKKNQAAIDGVARQLAGSN